MLLTQLISDRNKIEKPLDQALNRASHFELYSHCTHVPKYRLLIHIILGYKSLGLNVIKKLIL